MICIEPENKDTGHNVRLKRAVHDCHLDLVARMRYLSFSQVGTCNAEDI